MSGLNQKIEEIVSKSPRSSWKEKVEWRRVNKDWLRKSSEIAFRILDALDEKGWKKNRLAEELGVSAQQVSKYVKGEENFKLETLCNLERVLGVELIIVLFSDQEVKQKEVLEYMEHEAKVVKLRPDSFSQYIIEPRSSSKHSYSTAV
jgi:transcriptional regulator with XRE-family HTH domain